jgi:hypothetical protein
MTARTGRGGVRRREVQLRGHGPLLHYSVTCIWWLGVEDACKSTERTLLIPKVT